MVALHVFRDAERDAGGLMVQKWQFQRDLIIQQLHIVLRVEAFTSFYV